MISEDWDGDLQVFDYFIQTDDAIIGIYHESSEIVEGWVISSKSNIDKDQHITLDKNEVVEELYRDGINIIDGIPEWFYSDEGFAPD